MTNLLLERPLRKPNHYKEHSKFEGTLEEKVEALFEVNKRINTLLRSEDCEPSQKILRERSELAIEIKSYLNKQRIEPEELDYCIRNFSHFGFVRENKKISNKSLFDLIPSIKDFKDCIESNHGQKILTAYGDFPSQFGIISDNVVFKSERGEGYLYVPVKNLFSYNPSKNLWMSSSEVSKPKVNLEHQLNLVYINPSIFSHPKSSPSFKWEKERSLTTDHSKEVYFNDSNPEETSIYIGNTNVESILKRTIKYQIPAREEIRVVPSPPLE